LTGQHGLALDNLAQATVVVASGEALVANDTENPDLYWGIRGGGCNFGVVTEFVLRLHPQRPTVFAGLFFLPADKLEKIVEVTARWWKNASEKEGALQIAGALPDGTVGKSATSYLARAESVFSLQLLC
jgi:FAD/FMN-containing dehydrogenase